MLKAVRILIEETVLFAILVVTLVAVLLVALAIRVTGSAKRRKKFRALLHEWEEERQQREPS